MPARVLVLRKRRGIGSAIAYPNEDAIMEKLPPDKKQGLKQQWEEYNRLPEQERRKLGSTPRKPAAPARPGKSPAEPTPPPAASPEASPVAPVPPAKQ